MAETAVPSGALSQSRQGSGHRVWVRICHWAIAFSFLALAVSGYFILMVHPRLYWGEVGNDLTPALLELPISNNHRPEGWQTTVNFGESDSAPFSANRTYERELFNQNGWARSLHFLAAWVLVMSGAVYLIVGIASGHLKQLLPRQIGAESLWQDLKDHLHRRFAPGGAGPPYGPLQRCAYAFVVFIAIPFMVVTGLTMSPAVTAAYPFLLDVFGGYQSARTLHFFTFSALILFFTIHLAMVMLTGVRRHLRAMTIGD